MKKTILITGASGLIGLKLSSYLQQNNFNVLTLSRSKGNNQNSYQWLPEEGILPIEPVDRADIIINLAGENIAEGRWTDKRKKKLTNSRIMTTRLLVDSLNSTTDHDKKVFISASAIGIYGNRQDEIITEESNLGSGMFVTDLGKEWEQEANKARSGRTINIRIGIVLSPEGGALKKMLLPFKLGLGGTLGSGKQWMSWIGIEDLCSAINFIINHQGISGAVNLTSPNPVTNKEFTISLAAILKRPAFFPVPAFALKLALGQMADEILLSGCRCLPKKLLDAGFNFSKPYLKPCLSSLLEK